MNFALESSPRIPWIPAPKCQFWGLALVFGWCLGAVSCKNEGKAKSGFKSPGLSAHTGLKPRSERGFSRGLPPVMFWGPRSQNGRGGGPPQLFPNSPWCWLWPLFVALQILPWCWPWELARHCKSCPGAGRAQVGSCPMGCWRARAPQCKSFRGAGGGHACGAPQLSSAPPARARLSMQILPWCWPCARALRVRAVLCSAVMEKRCAANLAVVLVEWAWADVLRAAAASARTALE